jgi:carbon monoxide dehydrogenase subunit G
MPGKNRQQGYPAAARVRVPIAGETALSAVFEDVARLFNSPDRLWQLTPGCERIERIGPQSYRGWIRLGILGIAGSYTGVLKLHDQSSDHYSMSVNATHAGGAGSIHASGTIRLVAVDRHRTLVRFYGDIQVSRPSSLLGTRAIRGFTKLLLGQFFAAAEAELEAERAGIVARHGLLRNFCRYVARSLT